MKQRFLTVKETAEFLNLSADYIYQLTGEKRLPHIRIGRKILFDLNRLEKFIIECSIEPIDWPSKIQDWTK